MVMGSVYLGCKKLTYLSRVNHQGRLAEEGEFVGVIEMGKTIQIVFSF